MEHTTTMEAEMTATAKKDFAAECERRRNQGLKVFGAFALKDRIKTTGGIWDRELRAWLIPDEATAGRLGLVEKIGQHGRYFVTVESAKRAHGSRGSSGARAGSGARRAAASDRQLAAIRRMLGRLSRVEMFDSFHGSGAEVAAEIDAKIRKGITRGEASAIMDQISALIDDEM